MPYLVLWKGPLVIYNFIFRESYIITTVLRSESQGLLYRKGLKQGRYYYFKQPYKMQS